MENYSLNPQPQAIDDTRKTPSPSPQPRQRQQTPTDNELAHALLNLSVSRPEPPTPELQNLSRPSSSQLPGSYPETPAPVRQVVTSDLFNEAAFRTPVREPSSEESVQYPNLGDFSSPERLRSESPTPSAAASTAPSLNQLPSPEKTPEPSSSVASSKTLVILHDSCAKHRFSRNVKARELASIVERPERCRASILGIAAARTRLELEDSLDVTFDIVRSDRLGNLTDPAVIDVHGNAWPTELSSLCDKAVDTLAKGELEIPPPYHSGDLYLGEGSMEALRGCIGSVYDGVDHIIQGEYDRVHVSVRPPGHHCAESMPSGFCMINNVHVAIAYAHRKYGITRAAILDFDLHHGDGSQSIAWTINEKTNLLPPSRSPKHPSLPAGLRIGYFSLHDIYSFPCEDGVPDKVQAASLCLNAHGQTIWNVHLRHHPTEEAFDDIYESEYSALFRKAADFLRGGSSNDKCMVFLSAGFDASEHETKGMQRHGYHLPTCFYQRFASDAISLANRHAGGKILSVLEGGYADRAITSGTFAYMIGLAGVTESSVNRKSWEWWSVPRLTMLEKCSKKPPTHKHNGHTGDKDSQWVSETLALAAQLSPSSFVTAETVSVESLLLATPRMGLRERKKPVIPATAPPSTTKKRSQRVATPRTRKSMGVSEGPFVQASDAPPVPVPPPQLQREASPGDGLTSLMDSMKLTNGPKEEVKEEIRDEEGSKSAPDTPTPASKTLVGDFVYVKGEGM